MLIDQLKLGHGDANSLVHLALQSNAQSVAQAKGLSTEDVLHGIYTGPKAALPPIHKKRMQAVEKLSEFEITPYDGSG